MGTIYNEQLADALLQKQVYLLLWPRDMLILVLLCIAGGQHDRRLLPVILLLPELMYNLQIFAKCLPPYTMLTVACAEITFQYIEQSLL